MRLAVAPTGSPAAAETSAQSGRVVSSSPTEPNPLAEQSFERRLDAEGVLQRAVLAGEARAVAGRAAHGPDEHVLRRVLQLDELEHLYVVASQPQQLCARRVRHLGREALLQHPVAEQRRQLAALDLAEQLVLATGHGQDRARLPAHG